MFLSKLKANTDEEEENSQRLKYHFEDAKKSKIEDENEMNLIRRNFSYLFVNKAGGGGGQGLSQAEVNYRNTLNNTEKRLKSLREYQNNMDRLRMEANDTPISDASGPTSLGLNNNNNNSSSLNCLGSGASAKGKKSLS